MTVLSSFEVLAEYLVPQDILPPGAANPFLLQGFWVQVSIAPTSPVQYSFFNLVYEETTDFTQGAGQSALQAQVIDATGAVQVYPDFFASTGRGFLNQKISVGQTLIYGIQAIPGLTLATALPQAGTGWRGTVQLVTGDDGALVATPTQRLVYYSGDDILTAPVINACVYAVPTFTGTTQI